MFYYGKWDEFDFKVVYECFFNLVVFEDMEGKGIKFEDCFEEYFNIWVDVFWDSEVVKKLLIGDILMFFILVLFIIVLCNMIWMVGFDVSEGFVMMSVLLVVMILMVLLEVLVDLSMLFNLDYCLEDKDNSDENVKLLLMREYLFKEWVLS